MSRSYVAIMAGGIGSRFWPLSRVSKPKQFLDILGTGQSLLKTTFDRFAKIVPPENIYIVTGSKYVDLVKRQIPAIKSHQIVAEPLRRNTAPCIAYIANKINALDPEAQLVVAPSDHLILNEADFAVEIQKGLNYAAQGNYLLTLGIRPSRPDTGYGYIQYLEQKEVSKGIYKVKTFTEKPNLGLAKQFLDSGDFLWNSGIFIWSVSSIISAFEKHLPEVQDAFKEGKTVYNTPLEKEFIEELYPSCKNISIDYGVMEKADNVFVIPSNFGWSDLGTWTSLWDNHNKDADQNALSDDNIMPFDSKNNVIIAPKDKLVVVQGLDDYCIIDTGEILLICRKEDEQKIKEINLEVKSKKGKRFL